MSVLRRAKPPAPGIYDEVVSTALDRQLELLRATHAVELEAVGKDAEVDEQLVTLVRDAARIAIGSKRDAKDKIALAERLLRSVESEGLFREGELTLREQLLRSIRPLVPAELAAPGRPRGSILSSGLITNAHGQSVLEHLASEFDSADRIDLLCAFIKLSGLDKFRALIERHRARGRPLRVLTTTYMRATEAKAIEVLHRLGADVRVSYDEAATRLHAKAWLFHRESAYSTAYVGSSNLSHAAQTEGLEWNVRVTECDQPEVVEDMSSVFETYFRDADKFEPFDGSERAKQRLKHALAEPERHTGFMSFELEPKAWQKPMLRELAEARTLGRNANLVVAATGTGKTLVAAFDYDALLRGGSVDSLLFVAHRKEILEQARAVFRQVLGRRDFGELWVDGERPEVFRHVFASIQSLAQAQLDPAGFDHVIVDEVHHAAARTYGELLDRLKPKQLVGLTATPERADGRVYERHFPRPYVGNLRVWDAIDQQILVPFRYFVLDAEGVDVSEVRWNGGYVDADLSANLIQASDFWTRAVCRALDEHIARPSALKALAFCVDKAHAHVVAERLSSDAKLVARALTHDSSAQERASAKADLASGRVQVLCVVDLFNEGIDIPDVNTLFLFRPTESATVFLQQLGRGLRRNRDKDLLTVFDVTGRQHPSFRFDRHLRALLGHSPRELREFVARGFARLPSGCVVHFEERARAEILERIKRAVPTDVRGLRELLRDHAEERWDLRTFLAETDVDLFDVYSHGRSWTSLRSEVAMARLPKNEAEQKALGNIQKLLHASDEARLATWERLLRGEVPGSEAERRIAAMLCVVLYGTFQASKLDAQLETLRSHASVCAELGELIPVLRARADRLPRPEPLAAEVPLFVHAKYLDVELSTAFRAISKDKGAYRNFYTGVEPVGDGRYDLLLVTLDKADVEHEHLRYSDFALGPETFQWQSKASTRPDDLQGRRHLDPRAEGVTPLLFVRESKKDARGVTQAFRYLGPVQPQSARGERPITIEWALSTPLAPAWLRKWSVAS